VSEPAAHGPAPAHRTLRDIADDLLEYQRVEYIYDGVLSVMTPPGFKHGEIVDLIIEAIKQASFSGQTPVRWRMRTGDFQLNRIDDPQQFFIPDIAVAYPGSRDNLEFRENLAMVVEITSPNSPDTVQNDYGIKAKQYAKAGIPCYLLVDQEQGSWTVYALDGDWPGYQVYGSGKYGTPVKLPEPFGFELPTDEWPPHSNES
jgi:Uma2 family endonuclease